MVEDRKTFVVIEDRHYHIKYNLSEILNLFQNQGMVQIGKSLLVNVNHVRTLESELNGNYILTLSDQSTLVASKFYMKEFRNAILISRE